MRVLAFKGCVDATVTMARGSGKFSSFVMEGGWPEVSRNELAVIGSERAVGEEVTLAVSLPARGDTRRRRGSACRHVW